MPSVTCPPAVDDKIVALENQETKPSMDGSLGQTGKNKPLLFSSPAHFTVKDFKFKATTFNLARLMEYFLNPFGFIPHIHLVKSLCEAFRKLKRRVDEHCVCNIQMDLEKASYWSEEQYLSHVATPVTSYNASWCLRLFSHKAQLF